MSAFFGAHVINTTNQDLTVDSTDCELTSGTWYTWHDTDGSSLCDHLAAVITANASSATVTASVSSTGVLTLTGTANFSVEGFDAYALFGFSSNSLTGSDEYTATNRLQACWFPGREPGPTLAPTSEQGARVPLVVQQQAPDRTCYTTQIGYHVQQRLTFQFISKALTWTGTDTTRKSYQTWLDEVEDGRGILYVPDWTGSGSYSTYHEYSLDLADGAALAPTRQQQTKASDVWWTVTIPLVGL